MPFNIVIDPPINKMYMYQEKQCMEYLDGIPREISDFLKSTLMRGDINVMVRLPTSPTHVYLASHALMGKYDKNLSMVLLYYVEDFEDVFLRTFVHEVGHIYFEQKHRVVEEPLGDELILYKIVDESIANYFVFKFRCDEKFVEHVEELVRLLETYIVEGGVLGII